MSHPRLLPGLLDVLNRSDFVARKAGKNEIEVDVPRAPGREQARRELRLYLASWQARHPDARAELVD